MKKKYKLTKETIEICGKKLFRIQAIRDFGNVSKFGNVLKGDLGGFIEKEDNLSQEGNAWVYDDACVYDDAWVSGNARVFGDAWVSGNAWVFGDAEVSGNAWVLVLLRFLVN